MNKKELKSMDNKQIEVQEIKEIALDDFIKKAVDKNGSRKKEAKIPIQDYGKITFKRPTNNQLLEYIDKSTKAIKIDKNGDVAETDYFIMNEAAKELIYFTCPYLQNDNLQDALGISDPLDTPAAVFGIDDLVDIASKIKTEFEDDEKKIRKTIKNS